MNHEDLILLCQTFLDALKFTVTTSAPILILYIHHVYCSPKHKDAKSADSTVDDIAGDTPEEMVKAGRVTKLHTATKQTPPAM